MSFVSFVNDEINKYPELGDTIICHVCGKEHKIGYGETVKEDGTKEEDISISYVKCTNGKVYLVGLYGRDVTSKWK